MDNARAAWLLSGVRTLAVVLLVLLALAGKAAAAPSVADDAAGSAVAADTAGADGSAVAADTAGADVSAVAADTGEATTVVSALERVRRDPRLSSDPRAIDELVRVADASPPSHARVEAWMLAANAYAGRLDRPHEAPPLWEKALVDPKADRLTAALAVRALVDHALERGDVAGAERALTIAGDAADASVRGQVARAERRRAARVVSVAVLTIALLLALRAIVAAVLRRDAARAVAGVRASARFIAVYVAWLALGGAALASLYRPGTATPFLLLGVVVFALSLLARAWSAVGSTSARARSGRAALFAASAFASAFLVLERVDATYLEGLGL